MSKEIVVAVYYYPDYEKTLYVKGVYLNNDDVDEDITETYIVSNNTSGRSIDEDNTFWTRVPSRQEVKERYIEITFS